MTLNVKEMRQASYTVQMQAGECMTVAIMKMQLSSVQVTALSVHFISM